MGSVKKKEEGACQQGPQQLCLYATHITCSDTLHACSVFFHRYFSNALSDSFTKKRLNRGGVHVLSSCPLKIYAHALCSYSWVFLFSHCCNINHKLRPVEMQQLTASLHYRSVEFIVGMTASVCVFGKGFSLLWHPTGMLPSSHHCVSGVKCLSECVCV